MPCVADVWRGCRRYKDDTSETCPRCVCKRDFISSRERGVGTPPLDVVESRVVLFRCNCSADVSRSDSACLCVRRGRVSRMDSAIQPPSDVLERPRLGDSDTPPMPFVPEKPGELRPNVPSQKLIEKAKCRPDQVKCHPERSLARFCAKRSRRICGSGPQLMQRTSKTAR